ncbi:MAG: glycosyltransferase [Chlamydiota bacterium]
MPDGSNRRVLFIGLSGRDYPFVRVRCYDFARELAKHGISTAVLSFRDHLSGGLSEVEMWDRGDREKLWMNLAALGRLLREPGSLLYIQKIHYHAAAPFLMARLGLNRYILDYDDWDEGIHCLFKRPSLNRFFWGHAEYRPILAEVARRAQCCVVSSQLLADRLAVFNREIHLVPTGVDTSRFTPAPRPPRSPVVFGWNGVVWGDLMYENMAFMLDCFAETARTVPGVSLKIAGAGQQMGRVKALVAERYGTLDIAVSDWILFTEMPAFLHSIDVGLLPLVQAENDWVNSKSPTKYFEYLASGLPTVASPTAELRRLVADGVQGFLAGSRGEFVRAMTALAADPVLREAMGRRARRFAEEHFSLSLLGDRLAEIVTREE